MGYPPSESGMGYPLCLDLGQGTPPSRPGMGYPPPPHMCEQTENITFPHPSDAGGNKENLVRAGVVPSAPFRSATGSDVSYNVLLNVFKL